jgi:pilus assembly protein Flp/PilA
VHGARTGRFAPENECVSSDLMLAPTPTRLAWHGRCDVLGRHAAQGRGANRQPVKRQCLPHRPARGATREDVMDRFVAYVKGLRREEGQDLLEYALLVALIAIVAVGAVTAAGTQVSTIFNTISGSI